MLFQHKGSQVSTWFFFVLVVAFVCSLEAETNVVRGVRTFKDIMAECSHKICPGINHLQNKLLDIPHGPVVKNPPVNAGDSFVKIPHATGQVSQCTPTSEDHVPWSLHSTTREATTMRSPCTATRDEPPLVTTRDSPHSATNTQHSQK